MELTDTIVATSSPAGRSFRAIVRLSGAEAVRIASVVFACDPPLDQMPTYSSAAGTLRLEDGHIVCPATAYVMLAPRSYTREDIVELHTVGSPPLLAALVDALVAAGARPAEPGEFTRRAFLNGRIDLTQAEAVQAVIQARSQAELRVSQLQLSGTLRRAVESARADLVQLLAQVEASIDFVDQDIRLIEPAEALAAVDRLASQVHELERAELAPPPKEGVVTVLRGLPNAGKSSLLNALAGSARAIVTHIAGTTRDTIEHPVEIGGVLFRLVDTAGVRETGRAIEGEAVDRAHQAARAADLVLMVIDRSRPLSRPARAMWDDLCREHTAAICVFNKCDLPPRLAAADEERFAQSGTVVRVSAERGDGLADLKAAMAAAVRTDAVDRSAHSFWLGARHRDALRRAGEGLGRARAALADDLGLEFAAADLYGALNALGEIVGAVTSGDILDTIFSQFCIGK